MTDVFFFLKSKHNLDEVKDLMLKLLSQKTIRSYEDIQFFQKSLFQSVMENSSVDEQMEFFYFIDKANLMQPYIQVYREHMEKIATDSYRQLKKLNKEQ